MDNRLEKLGDIFDVAPETLTPETQLSSLDWDSMAKITLIVLLQDDYQKNIDVDSIDELTTIGDILALMI